MQNKARWTVPIEPQMGSLLIVLLMVPLFGISQPGYTSRASLLGAAVGSAFATLVICGWSYSWLRLGTKNQKAIQASRGASQDRQKIGYVVFALRLVLFLWITASLMIGAVWLVFRGMNGSAPSFAPCLTRALMVGTIAAFGLFVQALALDYFYRNHP